MAVAQLVEPVAPDRALPVEVQVRQPGRRPHERRSAAVHGVGQPHAVRAVQKRICCSTGPPPTFAGTPRRASVHRTTSRTASHGPARRSAGVGSAEARASGRGRRGRQGGPMSSMRPVPATVVAFLLLAALAAVPAGAQVQSAHPIPTTGPAPSTPGSSATPPRPGGSPACARPGRTRSWRATRATASTTTPGSRTPTRSTGGRSGERPRDVLGRDRPHLHHPDVRPRGRLRGPARTSQGPALYLSTR